MQIQTNATSANVSLKGYGYPIRVSLIAAPGGFLFGFETAVISGAEKTIQELCRSVSAGVYGAALLWQK